MIEEKFNQNLKKMEDKDYQVFKTETLTADLNEGQEEYKLPDVANNILMIEFLDKDGNKSNLGYEVYIKLLNTPINNGKIVLTVKTK